MDQTDVIEFYSKYSAQFDEKISALPNYDQTYIDFIGRARRKLTLLDLACGPGNVAKFMKTQVPDLQVSCVDLSPEMLTLAKAKLPDSRCFVADLLDISIPEEQYDLICCAFGLPYIEREKMSRVVSQLAKFAASGTLVYISCMQGSESKAETMSFGGDEKVLVHYHQKHDIVAHFAAAGFDLVDYCEIDYAEADGSTTIDQIFNFERQ